MNKLLSWREFIQPRLDAQRENLTRLLRTKLSGDPLARALAKVEKQDDEAILEYWFKRALTLSPADMIAELFLETITNYLHEIRTQTHLGERREALSKVLRTKLSGDVLERTLARVAKQTDLEILSRWFDLSLTLSPKELVAELDR